MPEPNRLGRGATPTPKDVLAAATPFRPEVAIGAPPNFIVKPQQISFWGNYNNGDCVTAEEAFAKACNSPEIFVPEQDVISWASAHGVLNGAQLPQVLQFMQNDGFKENGSTYDDGSYYSVDWTNANTLQSAISAGPVKIGVSGDQLETVWWAAGSSQAGGKPWFGTGFKNDPAEDHCVSLCGYGTIAWLAQQLNVTVPSGINGTSQAYALFTWDSIGIIDRPSLLAITHEAWLRKPTTKTVSAVPPSVSEPDAYAFINDSTSLLQQHNLFRSANGHIQALWFSFTQGWHYEDRTNIVAGVPPAVDGPFGYPFVDAANKVVEQHNLFRTSDGHIHALWFNFQTGWHHEDRSSFLPNVPPAVGKPFGYSFINDQTKVLEQHNLFRSGDGHIHALWFNFQTGWHHEDRTAMVAGTPAAVTDPVAYALVNASTGLVEQHHLFRSSDGHIHALWFNFQTGWHQEDRTAIVAGTPPAVGTPFGYAFINSATGLVEQHNLFRSSDGHIHALWFNFQTGWHQEDRTGMVAGTPPAVGDPFGYTFVDSAGGIAEQHNLFRTADGHIHALWFNFKTGWHQEDRTAMVAGTPPAVGDPFGYAFVDSASGVVEQHNLFRTADGHIHALWFNFKTGWHHEDRSLF